VDVGERAIAVEHIAANRRSGLNPLLLSPTSFRAGSPPSAPAPAGACSRGPRQRRG
jgi:hypothetical protein